MNVLEVEESGFEILSVKNGFCDEMTYSEK